MTEDPISLTSPERREYFRIDDEVLLSLCPITEDAVAEVARRITERLPDKFTVAANFAVNSRQMSRLLHTITANAADAGRYLKMVDQKLNQLARLFMLDEIESRAYPRLQVNLSGGGLVFPSPCAYAEGQMLEMRLILSPDMVGILTVGRVVHCAPRARVGDGMPWQVGVEYVHIREDDRDLLCRHIMNIETERLRRQRGEGADT